VRYYTGLKKKKLKSHQQHKHLVSKNTKNITLRTPRDSLIFLLIQLVIFSLKFSFTSLLHFFFRFSPFYAKKCNRLVIKKEEEKLSHTHPTYDENIC
jgi:hypothetical protein